MNQFKINMVIQRISYEEVGHFSNQFPKHCVNIFRRFRCKGRDGRCFQNDIWELEFTECMSNEWR